VAIHGPSQPELINHLRASTPETRSSRRLVCALHLSPGRWTQGRAEGRGYVVLGCIGLILGFDVLAFELKATETLPATGRMGRVSPLGGGAAISPGGGGGR
jgi:hypothetical protein